jgi:diguanylate cyclase (GGDEF)-like protein
LKFQSDLLRKLVFLDGLSGVFNRRYFDQQFATEWSRAARSGSPLSLVLLDVDFFKAFNDRYGHQSGDDCLRRIAVTLKVPLKRPADLVARYGGEEFACILPDTPFDVAMAIAGELEQLVRGLSIPHDQSAAAPVVTISVGVACRTTESAGDAPDLLALADQQLYKAKNTGRAKVLGEVLGAEPVAAL